MTKAEVKALVDRCVAQQGNQMGLEGIASLLGLTVDLLYAIAPEYDKTATYAKDALVIYEGKLYAAKQQIAVAEAWTAAHWEARTVAAAIALKADAE